MKALTKISMLALAIIMALSSFLLVGCGDKKDYNVIELNEVTRSIFYAPLYVAINNNYFQEEGLTVNLSTGGGSDTSMSSLLTGSADIILAGPETAVYTDKEGVKNAPKVFGQLTQCDGSFIVSKEDEPNFSLENLVGETIIGGRTGGVPAMTLQYIIEHNGYTIGTGANEINLRTDVAFNLTASVWENDATVKYCTLFEPTATNVTKTVTGSKIVASLGQLSGTIPYTCFIARENYMAKHSDVITRFLKAVGKAYKFITTEDSTDVANSLLASFPGNTVEELSIAVDHYKEIDAWDSDFVMDAQGFANLMNVMMNAGVITERARFNDVVDNSYANSLIA